MIDELREFEYEIIQDMGYVIYDEIGRKQTGDGTWSKIIKENGKFIMTGTKYGSENFEKKEFREIYDNVNDLQSKRISREKEEE